MPRARTLLLACVAALTVAATARALTPAAQNRVIARRAAVALLAEVHLPAGAARLPGEPAGDHGALAPLRSLSATPAAVDRHAYWRVPRGIDATVAYLEHHPPTGAVLDYTGSGSGPAGETMSVAFAWGASHGLVQRELLYVAAALATGRTVVLAQAEAVWLVPRPESERVPAGVREVDVTSRRLGGPRRVSLRVTAPTTVRALVAYLDGLPIVQPFTIACPALVPAGAWTIDIAFRAHRGGPVLARAGYLDLAPLDAISGPCNPVSFSVGGRSGTPLIGGPFVPRLDQILAARLTG